jgi:hypothetical protein
MELADDRVANRPNSGVLDFTAASLTCGIAPDVWFLLVPLAEGQTDRWPAWTCTCTNSPQDQWQAELLYT